MEEEKEKQSVAGERRRLHAQQVRRQVEQKEREQIMARKAFFDEGIKLDQEARER